jgi:hypothetical protein
MEARRLSFLSLEGVAELRLTARARNSTGPFATDIAMPRPPLIRWLDKWPAEFFQGVKELADEVACHLW